MHKYIAKRLVQTIPSLLGVTLLVFALSYASGDPVLLMLPPEATPQQVQEMREQLGLSDPIFIQFGRFAFRALQGDFGTSLRHNEPAIALLWERVPATVHLALSALILMVLIGVPLGTFAAMRKGGFLDSVCMTVSLVGQSVPSFWIGLMLIFGLGIYLNIFPVSGREEATSIIMPSITLAFYYIGAIARLTRASVYEVLCEDFIRTARSKGLSEFTVIIRHTLKNAMRPVLTVLGMQFGHLLGGAVITESIFAWPGIGRLLLQAIYGRDFPVVQVCTFFIAVSFIMINLVVDILYVKLDPRVTHDIVKD